MPDRLKFPARPPAKRQIDVCRCPLLRYPFSVTADRDSSLVRLSPPQPVAVHPSLTTDNGKTGGGAR